MFSGRQPRVGKSSESILSILFISTTLCKVSIAHGIQTQTSFTPSPCRSQVQQSGTPACGCQLLDKKVGRKCLVALMGIGKRRLQRLEGGAPDLRYGKREYRSRAGTWTIDSFLQICYDNIAETLPDRFLLGVLQHIFTIHFQ